MCKSKEKRKAPFFFIKLKIRRKLNKKEEISFNCVIIESKEEFIVLKVGDFNDW